MSTPELSGRQQKIGALVARGYTNREIAAELQLNEQVVKNVVHALFDRLGVWNRVELANRFSDGASPAEAERAQQRIEAERLAELDRLKILDTVAERVFDELTELAVSICDVPIALIVLVDAKRAWFKSNIGLDFSEAPREITICRHTIQQSKVFVVGNLLEDDRFNCIPAVVSAPKIRFYAAAPMLTDDGYALGVLCVLDRVPRTFSASQAAVLQSLARLALRHLELRSRLMSAAA